MKIAIHVHNGTATTRDARGRVIVGPFRFSATRFVAEESSAPSSGDGTYVYEGEWAIPPRPERQPS
jgi:hypothetical protein